MFSGGGVTLFFTCWWTQYDNRTTVHNEGVKIPRPSFVNTRRMFTTCSATTLPVQWRYRHITEAATDRCCTPCQQALKRLLLFCCCRSLSLAPHVEPERRQSLYRQAALLGVLGLPFRGMDAHLLSQPAWHLLNRATRRGADIAIWRDGRRRWPVSWKRLPLDTQCDVLPSRRSRAQLLCSRRRQPTIELYFPISCPVGVEGKVCSSHIVQMWSKHQRTC